MSKKKTILVTPLNWGLGHATRCIPIIRALLKYGFDVLLASDGEALLLLQKEFPALPFIELPSYNISYTKKAKNFKWKLILKLPAIKMTMDSERKLIKILVEEKRIYGIISDNRLGVYQKNIPSVFITHQLNVITGSTTYLSSKMHQHIIKKFTECWVPDVDGPVNLSGKLGHLDTFKFPLKYIGPLSRMQKKNIPIIYKYLVLLSGPEPQRSMLEAILLAQLKKSTENVLFIKGIVENEQISEINGNITTYNFMKSFELEEAINQSEVIISRSGYTTIMDLAQLGKKAFFIPTPGQYEQKYLAKRFKNLGLVPSCRQENFSLNKLDKVKLYKGLQNIVSSNDFEILFRLFEGK